MKQLRNLSGVYFREQIDGKWTNVCFEELSEKKQKEILANQNPEFIGRLLMHMVSTINSLGEQLNLQKD